MPSSLLWRRGILSTSCFSVYISSNTPQLTGGLKQKLPNRSIIHPPKTDFMMNCKCKTDLPLVKNASARLNHRNKQTNKKRIIILFSANRWSTFLTCFFGELCEGLHSLLSVAALWGNGGDVSPAEGSDNVHHGLGLEWVGRNHPWEEVIAPVVTQLWGCWRIADLRDLEEKKWDWGGEGNIYSFVCTILVQHHRWLLRWLLWQITFLNGCVWNHFILTIKCTTFTVCHFQFWEWNLCTIGWNEKVMSMACAPQFC